MICCCRCCFLFYMRTFSVSLSRMMSCLGAGMALVVCGVVLCVDEVRGAPPLLEVGPQEAGNYVGEEVRVTMYVRQTGYNASGKHEELYSDFAWDAPRNLMIRLTPAVQERLAGLGIYRAAEHFSARSIRVRGRVEELNFGKITVPAIYVQALEQIEVLRPKEYELAEAAYQKVSLDILSLYVSPELEEKDAAVRKELVETMQAKVEEIRKVLPAASYEKLKGAVIIANRMGLKPGAAYHTDLGYLNRTGIPGYYHQAVEIQQAAGFLHNTLKVQPSAVLHELAHKFHHEVLSAKHAGVLEAFEAAKAAGIYERVAYAKGLPRRAYAMASVSEYFAELTEAYFGRNDFYPFVRSELKSHDPKGYAMIEACWGVGAAEAAAGRTGGE